MNAYDDQSSAFIRNNTAAVGPSVQGMGEDANVKNKVSINVSPKVDNTTSEKFYPISDKFYEIEIDESLSGEDSPYSQKFNLSVPLDLISNCHLQRAFMQYAAFTCKSIEILFTIASLPDTSGSYLFGFVPMINQTSSVSQIPGNNYPRFYSVEDVVNIDLSITRSFLMSIPWWFYKSHILTRGDKDADVPVSSIGRLICMTNVPLLATPDVSQVAGINMQVRFVEPEFMYPVSLCSTADSEKKLRAAFKKATNYRDEGAKTSKTTHNVTNVYLDGDNNAIQVAPEETNDFETGGTSASVSMTKGADFDKPAFRAPPIPTIPADTSLNMVDGAYKTEFMGPRPEMAKLGVLVPSKDVGSFNYLMSRPVPVFKTTITTETLMNDFIAAAPVTPAPNLNAIDRSGATTDIPVSPSDYLSTLFSFWAGRIKVRVKFYGNNYQTFSIRASCNKGATLAEIGTRSQQTTQSYIDFDYTKECREFEFWVENENLGLYFYTTTQYWADITVGELPAYFSSILTFTLTKTLQTTGLNRVVMEIYFDCSQVKFFGRSHYKAFPHEIAAEKTKQALKIVELKSLKQLKSKVAVPVQPTNNKTTGKRFSKPPPYEDQAKPLRMEPEGSMKGQTLCYYSHIQEIFKTFNLYTAVHLDESQKTSFPMSDVLGNGVLDFLLSMYTMIRGGMSFQIYSTGSGVHNVFWDPIPMPDFEPPYVAPSLDGCNKMVCHPGSPSINLTVPDRKSVV